MKTNSTFLLLTILFISSLIQCQVKTEEERIVEMLRTFYTNYMTEVSGEADINRLDSLKHIYCNPALLERIQIEFDRGELGYDPVINAQDVNIGSIRTLSIKKDSIVPDYYYVSYKDPYWGVVYRIKLRIVKQNDNYLIDDIL